MISRFFFDDRAIGRITNVRPGLSDPHHNGRSVTLLESDCGRLIYKPRSGRNETAWFELLQWMNWQGFTPKLRAARVLGRGSYSWMEYVGASPCKSHAAVRRFYERVGGIVAAAYHVKAVDCHRENLIAAGECPVLVDADALWHVSALTRTQSPTEILYRTGFFSNSKRRSLQSRSSILGWTTTGKHIPTVKGRPLTAGHYSDEIIRGFSRGWRCLVGNARRRAALDKRIKKIRNGQRRWIYLATEKYAAIRRASFSPTVMQSERARNAFLKRLCLRNSVSGPVIRAEIEALRRLDLPYFLRQTSEPMPPESDTVPNELLAAIRAVLPARRTGRRR